jgi:DNA-binding transcriptional MerR regulator
MGTTTIRDVARFAGITVRTLHHYDAIGLLTPSERRESGYRC